MSWLEMAVPSKMVQVYGTKQWSKIPLERYQDLWCGRHALQVQLPLGAVQPPALTGIGEEKNRSHLFSLNIHSDEPTFLDGIEASYFDAKRVRWVESQQEHHGGGEEGRKSLLDEALNNKPNNRAPPGASRGMTHSSSNDHPGLDDNFDPGWQEDTVWAEAELVMGCVNSENTAAGKERVKKDLLSERLGPKFIDSGHKYCTWRQASLQGGMLYQRLLSVAGRERTVQRYRGISEMTVPFPLERTPFMAHDLEMKRWSMLGLDIAPFMEPAEEEATRRKKKDDENKTTPVNQRQACLPREVDDLLNICFWSRVLPLINGPGICALLEAAAVTREDNGDTVLIIGPPKSGKTTLALHCTNHPGVQLLGDKQVTIAPTPPPAGSVDALTHQVQFLCAGGFKQPITRYGAALGSLYPNPKLESLLYGETSQAVEMTAKNTEQQLWTFDRELPVNMTEVFGPNKLAYLGKIVGVVCLDWPESGFERSTPTMLRKLDHDTALRAAKQCVHDSQEDQSLVRPLLTLTKQLPSDVEQMTVLHGLVEKLALKKKAVQIGGGIHFDKAKKFILNELLDLKD